MDSSGYHDRLVAINRRIDETSRRYDLAIMEARQQIDRVEELLDRVEAASLAKRWKADEAA